MQKLNFTPLTQLKSTGDINLVPDILEADVGSQLTSPLTTIPSQRKSSLKSPFKQRKSQKVLEFTDQLDIWNQYLSRKFSKCSFQLQ